MWDTFAKYAFLGLARGFNGLSKHTKEIMDPKNPAKMNWIQFGGSIAIAGTIGIGAEMALGYFGIPVGLDQTGLIGTIVSLVAPWFGTGIIEDIIKAKA